MKQDETSGVWTATMKVTNIQTLLGVGPVCPDKNGAKNIITPTKMATL